MCIIASWIISERSIKDLYNGGNKKLDMNKYK